MKTTKSPKQSFSHRKAYPYNGESKLIETDFNEVAELLKNFVAKADGILVPSDGMQITFTKHSHNPKACSLCQAMCEEAIANALRIEREYHKREIRRIRNGGITDTQAAKMLLKKYDEQNAQAVPVTTIPIREYDIDPKVLKDRITTKRAIDKVKGK